MTGRLLFFIYLFGPDVKTAQNQRDRRLHSWPAYKELLTLLLLLQHKLFSTIFSKTLRKFTSPRRVSVTFHSNNVTKANYFVGKLLVASTMKTCCYDNSMNLNRLCVIINTVWMMREWVNKWILLPWLVGDRVSNKNGIVKVSRGMSIRLASGTRTDIQLSKFANRTKLNSKNVSLYLESNFRINRIARL